MLIDPILKPRITEVPSVSDKTLSLFKDSLVWDNILPWVPWKGGSYQANIDLIDELLPRFLHVGVNHISLTVGLIGDIDDTLRHMARVRREIDERADWLMLAQTVSCIRRAKHHNKLAVSFNFQDSLPFSNQLDMIQVYYDLGVRQVGLVYNQRNLVGDGCAEKNDGGLSNFGRAAIQEMHRVGMLVDGSHVGYRTSMQAMELGGGPFIFSHSNPYAVRPHYRNIKDDQIKACAAAGGVIGINGVGAFVGDMDAPTEAIFRCLDYTVELVGPEYVGIGFDYVHDLDLAINAPRMAPLAWPAYQGEELLRHNYAGPEQLVHLTQLMLDHGYSDSAIEGILGGNWACLCEQVWQSIAS